MNKRHKLFVIAAGLLLLFVAMPIEAADKLFEDPLGGNITVVTLLKKIIGFMLYLSGFLAMAAMVWGGILYILSLGNDQRVEYAKKIIMWAAIGIIVIVLSFFIINTLASLLGATGA